MTEEELVVCCDPVHDGWSCAVRIGQGAAATEHVVAVERGALHDLAPGRTVEALVDASVRFLLEREPRESILRRFDLPVISHYFPEYREEIRRRLSR